MLCFVGFWQYTVVSLSQLDVVLWHNVQCKTDKPALIPWTWKISKLLNEQSVHCWPQCTGAGLKYCLQFQVNPVYSSECNAVFMWLCRALGTTLCDVPACLKYSSHLFCFIIFGPLDAVYIRHQKVMCFILPWELSGSLHQMLCPCGPVPENHWHISPVNCELCPFRSIHMSSCAKCHTSTV